MLLIPYHNSRTAIHFYFKFRPDTQLPVGATSWAYFLGISGHYKKNDLQSLGTPVYTLKHIFFNFRLINIIWIVSMEIRNIMTARKKEW